MWKRWFAKAISLYSLWHYQQSTGLSPGLCIDLRERELVFLIVRYSWCSSRLIDEEFRLKSTVELNDMIPLESNPSQPSLVIGHNVAFDRTYIKDQYQLEVNLFQPIASFC